MWSVHTWLIIAFVHGPAHSILDHYVVKAKVEWMVNKKQQCSADISYFPSHNKTDGGRTIRTMLVDASKQKSRIASNKLISRRSKNTELCSHMHLVKTY